MLSFAAENEARMEAMIAARSNVTRKLDELVGNFRRLRQEEITSEIIELSAGSISAAASAKHKRSRAAALNREKNNPAGRHESHVMSWPVDGPERVRLTRAMALADRFCTGWAELPGCGLDP